jgi:hypothetical protein
MTVVRTHVCILGGALGALFLTLVPWRAMAQQAAPLLLEAPCITQAELEARVQPLLPAASNAPSALQGVQVRVRTAEPAPEQEAEILLPAHADQPATTRTLRGESCETVIDAAIIVLGLWVSESAQAAPLPVAPAPAPPKPSPTEADDDTEIVHWSLTLGALVSHALLPSTALGAELATVLSWRTLRLSLGGRWWPSQRDALSSSQVAAELIEGDLQIGWLPLQLGRFELGPVAGLAVGQLHVAGVDVEDAREKSLLWMRSELALHARHRWSQTPLAVWATVGGAVPWSRPWVNIGGEGPVYRPAAVSPYGALGVELVLR